jgi:pentalenene oxygenase
VLVTDEEGEGLSDHVLSDQVAVLLLAGGETTSPVVVWSFYLLDKQTEALEAVREETDTVFGDGASAWKALPRLEATGRVVREALRLQALRS